MKWLLDEGHITERIHIPKIKTPENPPSLLSDQQVRALIRYKPKNRIERRVHMMILVVLDTGLRADEVFHIKKADVDLDNLLLTVRKAKGGKFRIVPFSLSLRRSLYRFLKTEPHELSEYVFSTRAGLPQTYRNAHRQLKFIGSKIGAPGVPFHLLRHQWARHYLRSGGSIALLRRQLGHSSLDTVLFYEHLASSDLSPSKARLRIKRDSLIGFTAKGALPRHTTPRLFHKGCRKGTHFRFTMGGVITPVCAFSSDGPSQKQVVRAGHRMPRIHAEA